MGAPPIQFTNTADGARIAYWVLGDGPTAIVHLPYPWSHVRNEWSLPEVASWYERLGAGRTLISYDGRWRGLSVPPPAHGEPTPAWFETCQADLEAVLDAAGVQRFALLASWVEGTTAIRFASAFPERVSHLVLWCASARVSAMYDAPVRTAFSMATADIKQYGRLVAHSFIGWSEDGIPDGFVDRYLDAVLPDLGQLRPEALYGKTALSPRPEEWLDLSDEARGLDVPTLVLHSRGNTFMKQETASELAATIPGAKLVLLDGESMFLPVGVADQALDAINSFLAEPASSDDSEAGTSIDAAVAGGPPYPDGLSAREVEVLRLLATGASNPEIAAALVISINTVTSHITSIYSKTGANNRVEATRYAIVRRLTE